MKLMIRFANKIVGVLIILGIGFLIFVIFMLGSNQRWFSRDYYFKSFFSSAAGLSTNMSVQHKGFTIGHVKLVALAEDDRVEVHYTIFDTYIDRVRYGSLVDVQASPIGMGSSFIFYPGYGEEQHNEWDIIPTVNSKEGRRIIHEGLAVLPESDDSISNLINRANVLLESLTDLIDGINHAFGGTSDTTLGRTMQNVELSMAGLSEMAEKLPSEIEDSLKSIMDMLDPILKDFGELSNKLAAPEGMVMTALDAEGDVYTSLNDTLKSLSETMKNIALTSNAIPGYMPQIGTMLIEINKVLQTVDDVMIAAANNPLLRGGVPQRVETKVGGTQPRDMEF